jgi:predicted nucleic acid-binding protein
MDILVDTSVLGRLANADDPDHALASFAVMEVYRRGDALRAAAQSFVEFRNFATRPVSANGLGLSVAVAEARAEGLESLFPVLLDTEDIYPAWKVLADEAQATGKQVHDVRLVAICRVHGISGILTFNVRHFRRLAAFVPGLAVLDPISLAAPSS